MAAEVISSSQTADSQQASGSGVDVSRSDSHLVVSTSRDTGKVQFRQSAHCYTMPNKTVYATGLTGGDCQPFTDDIISAERSKKRCVAHGRKYLFGTCPSYCFGPKAKVSNNLSTTVTIQNPDNQLLVWLSAPLTVLIVHKFMDTEIIDPFMELVLWLTEELRLIVFVERKVVQDPLINNHKLYSQISSRTCTFDEEFDDLSDKIDFIICLGGDGTLLYVSSLFQKNIPPVMAFHFGSLGFLSALDYVDMKKKVKQVLEDRYINATLKFLGKSELTDDFEQKNLKLMVREMRETAVSQF